MPSRPASQSKGGRPIHLRLVELDPRWLIKDGRRVGFIFRSPADPKWFQSCIFERMTFKEQCALLRELGLTTEEDDWPLNVQTCNPDCAWTPTGDSFDNLSVTPSIDGSAGGLWHGFVTKGEIV